MGSSGLCKRIHDSQQSIANVSPKENSSGLVWSRTGATRGLEFLLQLRSEPGGGSHAQSETYMVWNFSAKGLRVWAVLLIRLPGYGAKGKREDWGHESSQLPQMRSFSLLHLAYLWKWFYETFIKYINTYPLVNLFILFYLWRSH